MTSATLRALEGLRDPAGLKWYVIPMLAYTFYIYTLEMKKARASGDWNVVLAGLTIFGMDFINETWNGWVLVFTGRSAMWTTPGETALRTMVGWNIEIMFMFAIAGIIFANTVSENPEDKILGIPNRWFWAIGYAAFCVFVEVLLNLGGHLVWEYPLWHASFKGVWLIFLFGYFHFYVAAILVMGLKSIRAKITLVSALYVIAISANIFGMGIMGWVY